VRARNPTPGGLGVAGVAPARPEISVAIPLPTRDAEPEEPDDNNETRVMESGPPPARRVPSKPPPPLKRSTPPPAPSSPPGRVVSPRGAPPPPGAPIYDQATVGPALYGDVTRAVPGEVTIKGVPPAPPTPGARIYEQATVGPSSHTEATRLAHDEVRAVAAGLRDDVSGPTAPFAVSNVRALIQDDWAVPPPPRAPQLLPDSEPSYEGDDGGPARQAPPPRSSGAAANPWAATEPESSGPPLPDHGALDAAFAAAGGSPGAMQTPTPGAIRAAYVDDTYGEHRPPAVSQRRAGAARWIVGLVVAGMAALTLATVGKRLLVSAPAPKGGEADARIATLLADGEKALEGGDLESAKERFDKASVLAERDPRAAADLARLAAARADVEWLRVRLYPEGDPDQIAAKRDLADAAQRARKAADQAAEIAPADAAVIRSRIDALRFAGDLDGARKLVGGISGAGGQPDNALALAELDLAESRPDWTTVIARLRTALGGDGNLGRARAMLIYALVRSRDYPGAETELGRLAELPRPHPLAGALRAYITRTERSDANALPDVSARPSTGAGGSRAPVPPPGGSPPPSPSPSPREVKEREHPVPVEPRPAPLPEMPAPTPPPGPVDTSDLPGVKAQPPPPPTKDAPAPPPVPTSTVPPGVDTSDLPGFK
jgi:tetratricopeptide (TPR) repeat protein